jgi:alkaline phosphatase D
MSISRRSFLETAAALGASLAWVGPARGSGVDWRERRDLYPEGVASGEILWTRRPFAHGTRQILTVEVAEDAAFGRVIAQARAPVSSAADWTARVLIGGLEPAHVYWYRFTDAEGNGSRVGRTITAPLPDDPRPVNFAFVSCQDINEGKLNAYRRMIHEDERALAAEQLGFVLHLGDFIYEVIEYPDEVKTRYDRTIYEVARIPDGHKVGSFHIPLTPMATAPSTRATSPTPTSRTHVPAGPSSPCGTTMNSRGKVGKASSRQGRSSSLARASRSRPTRPGSNISRRVSRRRADRSSASIPPRSGTFRSSSSTATDWESSRTTWRPSTASRPTAPCGTADAWTCSSPTSTAIGTRIRSAIPLSRSWAARSSSTCFPSPGCGSWTAGEPSTAASRRRKSGSTRRMCRTRSAAPQTILGAEQKAWFKDKLRKSTAVWKIWGNSEGALDWRADPQNLPAGLTKEPWPKNAYASLGGGDYGTAYLERAEIYDLVRDAKITGFAIVSGDRHSFWAGYAAAELPPGKFEPVGLSFVGGSLSSPGIMEAYEHKLPKDAPLRSLFLADRGAGAAPDWTFNMLLRHGVRACLEYARTFDLKRARSMSNPELAPHLEFVDLGGHGYAKVRLSTDEMRTEFVCIPRPVARSDRPDGGPIRYRVSHTAASWNSGQRPQLKTSVIEGDVGLSI